MSVSTHMNPVFRELSADEHSGFYDHLLRLGATSRYMRFGYAVSDDFLKTYCTEIGRLNIVTYGAFVGGVLRAVAELRRVSEVCPHDGEIGLTVEDDWQDAGIGTELLAQVQAVAKLRGIETIYMICSRKNYRMRSVAHKAHAQVNPLHNQIFPWESGSKWAQADNSANAVYGVTDLVTFSLDL